LDKALQLGSSVSDEGLFSRQVRRGGKHPLLLQLAASSVLLCFLGTSAAWPQQTTRKKTGEIVQEATLETYARVLDIVFPQTSETSRELELRIVLRFRPSFSPESQITISLARGSEGNVEYISAAHNIHDTINELIRTTGENQPGSLSKQIRVDRQILSMPAAQVFEWQKGLFESLHVTSSILRKDATQLHERGIANVILDGESYELWYTQGLTKFCASFAEMVDDRSDRNNEALDSWIKRVHNDVIEAIRKHK
jgi:hypothetical protein